MNIENTLFYTFSAIPQTLAGAIGIMGAFVLYKFQSLDNEIRNKANEILVKKGVHQNDPNVVDALRQAFVNSCIYGEEFSKKRPFNTTWFKGEEGPIRKILLRKIDLRRQLLKSATITSVVILMSLLVLMNVSFIKQYTFLYRGFFVLGFLGSFISVLSYVCILAYALIDTESNRSIFGVMQEAWSKLKK